MATVHNTTFRLRRGLSEIWARNNPILDSGEPGFELDTNKLKIGNGSDAWNDLPYLVDLSNISLDGYLTIIEAAETYISKKDLGEAPVYALNEEGEKVLQKEGTGIYTTLYTKEEIDDKNFVSYGDIVVISGGNATL